MESLKATDLRIGNTVKYANGNITAIQQGWELDEGMELYGIPLTEEWLEKFGFERKEGGDSEYWTIQIGNNLNLTISLADNTAGIDLEWRSQGSQIWMMIDSVHKVQNVFYYLSGEELEVKS